MTIIEQVRERFPTWAKMVVLEHLDQSKPHNKHFADHLDDPRHHKPEWHEWGILTHTRKFEEAFTGEARELAATWKILSQWDEHFSHPIDGRSRAELFQLGIILHDLGKFGARYPTHHQTGIYPDIPDFTFSKHEAVSENLMHQSPIKDELIGLDLTENQITYIGRVAALHYELAKVRDSIKYQPGGYSIDFIRSEKHSDACKELIQKHPEHKVEVGVAYLCDSLAKTSFRITPDSISPDTLLQLVTQRGLDTRHVSAALGQHISIEASRSYLETVFSS